MITTGQYSLYSVIVPSLALFARFLRSIHADLDRVRTRVPRLNQPALDQTCNELRKIWAKTKPFSFVEALQLPTEQRALAFRCLGPANIFRAAAAKKIGSEAIKRRTAKVVAGKIVETGERDETYELYEIAPERLGMDDRRLPIRAVRCNCPSTGEEHWLLVEKPTPRWTGRGRQDPVDTPIAAIASTIITNVENPQALWRQGDLIAISTGDKPPRWCAPRPMLPDQYLSLSQIET